MAPKSTSDATTGFSTAERAAMKERARELKAEARASKNRAEGESAVQAALAAMPEPDRGLGERLHALVSANAPDLWPRLWYGMPAYARDGKVVCFYQPAHKFNSRYGTLGFTDAAHLDDGAVWPTTFGLKELAGDDEARVAELIKRAVR